MDPVIHFEMPYDDRARMAAFYEKAFAWRMDMLGEEMGHYVLASTTETDSGGRPRTPGAINGGFFPRGPGGLNQHPSVVISVGDLRASAQKVRDAGGTVHGEPMEIPGIGTYLNFTDPEGNYCGMLQPPAAA